MFPLISWQNEILKFGDKIVKVLYRRCSEDGS